MPCLTGAVDTVLKDERVTSVLIGASSPEQLRENVLAIENLVFSPEEQTQIQDIIGG